MPWQQKTLNDELAATTTVQDERPGAKNRPTPKRRDQEAARKQPLVVTAWNRRIWTVPPPSQGYLTLAGAWIADRLDLPVGRPVIAVQRIAFNIAGKPIEWRCTRGSADGFQYEVEVR